MTRALVASVGIGLLVFGAAAFAADDIAEIDTQHTRIEFTLKTRWGQVLEGRFPNVRGQVETLPDGRLRTRLVMSARTAEIIGHRNYTDMLRGRGFFEADKYPDVEFVSDPYAARLLSAGGALTGQLQIRDQRRKETFTLGAGTCARPTRDCDAVANGSVRRSDYGVDRWRFAVSDHVRFTLRLRVREARE